MKNKLMKNILIGASILTIGLFPISYFNIKKEKDIINYQVKEVENKTIDDEYITADVNIGSSPTGTIVAEFDPFYLQKGDYSYVYPDYKYVYDLYEIENFVIEIPYTRLEGDSIGFGNGDNWVMSWTYDSSTFNDNEYKNVKYSVIPDYIYNKGPKYTQWFVELMGYRSSNEYYAQLKENGTIHLAIQYNFNPYSSTSGYFDGGNGKTSKPIVININYQNLSNDEGYKGYGEKYDIWYKEEKDNAYTIKLKTASKFDGRLGTIYDKDQKSWNLDQSIGAITSTNTVIDGKNYYTDIAFWEDYYYSSLFGVNAITNTINLGTIDLSNDAKDNLIDSVGEQGYWYSDYNNYFKWYVPYEQVANELGFAELDLPTTSSEVLDDIVNISNIDSEVNDTLSNIMKEIFIKINDLFARVFDEAGVQDFYIDESYYNEEVPTFSVETFREDDEFVNSKYYNDFFAIKENQGRIYFEINGSVDFSYSSYSSMEGKLKVKKAFEAIFAFLDLSFSNSDIDKMIEELNILYEFKDYNYSDDFYTSFEKTGIGVVPLSDGGSTSPSIRSNSEILLIVLTIISILMLVLMILLLFKNGVKEDKGVQIVTKDEGGAE